MSNNMTSTTSLSEKSQNNLENIEKDLVRNTLDQIELDIVSSNQYFKPRPGTTYMIKVDEHKIKPVENPKFTDAQGKPLKRYELVIVHVNNQKEQIWTVSKTVCLQIIERIRKGFRTLKVTRTGTDRSTTYAIEGVQ